MPTYIIRNFITATLLWLTWAFVKWVSGSQDYANAALLVVIGSYIMTHLNRNE